MEQYLGRSPKISYIGFLQPSVTNPKMVGTSSWLFSTFSFVSKLRSRYTLRSHCTKSKSIWLVRTYKSFHIFHEISRLFTLKYGLTSKFSWRFDFKFQFSLHFLNITPNVITLINALKSVKLYKIDEKIPV